MKRAFTLIELLVVIAIIAILAAILFPVFAQAKAQAKKAASLSNVKQIDLAAQMYLNDADDLFPIQTGANDAGQWGYLEGQLLIPPNWSTAAATDPRVEESYGLANNTVQPYTKNLGILLSPAGSIDPYAITGAYFPNNTQPLLKYSYTFNGLMTGWNETASQSLATVPVWWSGMGNVAMVGYSLANPEIACGVANQPCTYQPYTPGCSAAVNGQTGLMWEPGGSMWEFNNGQNWSYGDGHAKFRKVGNTLTPNVSNPYVEPFVNYDANGKDQGFYWYDGCHAWLFRPDYVPPSGFN